MLKPWTVNFWDVMVVTTIVKKDANLDAKEDVKTIVLYLAPNHAETLVEADARTLAKNMFVNNYIEFKCKTN